MWRFVSAARMAQIKADARAEGYIKAVREGLAANDAAKDLRSVTRDNTHAANTAVQEMKAEMNQGVVKKRKMRPYKKSSYSDKNVILIREGSIVEELVFEKMGKMTYQEIAILVNKSHGTHVRGAQGPIRITTAMIGAVASRSYVWNAHLQYFVKGPKKH